ncbi:transglycosylase domain-containing protein [Bacillus solimangrovi]|uniref:Monofunctional biosynthetic peptidoglycan transglycosylase n=1 Tax=Bacillus solimangrovi TaxID=1305675 RepID=A0A1E5LGP1_9BACI|nr:PBP1A family penicillin-binding protein [Bacillus solimangrovi]OEH93242.1 monofunctional biosynthetic peptidoglycan transglycosylase [Bacillus solimangrovi]
MEIITERIQRSWKWIRALLFIAILIIISLMLVIFSAFIYGVVQGPPPLNVSQTSVFYANDGTVIGESHYGEERYWVELEEISPHVIDATLSVEDRKFFKHFGFDLKRIAGAAIADIKAGAKVQGASTITQQYARNLYLSHEKTWTRKLNEALYTIRLETNYSKDEILEGYLNTIYYGNGMYGIEAAAKHYFNKSALDLSLSEASLLAGIPKAPSHYSPFLNYENSKKRQAVVLNAMVAQELLSIEDAQAAMNESIIFNKNETTAIGIAPYFQDIVRKTLQDELNFDEQTLAQGGLRVHTTLDPFMQQAAEKSFEQIIREDSNIQASLIAMDPYSGAVKALVGGRSYEESPYNRAVQAIRMPGSTFKPILFYNAIDNGFTPSTVMRSEPMTFRYDEGKATYTPSNYNNYYANDFITLAQAIALSDNIYAVKAHMFLGPEKLVDTAKEIGISSDLLAVPSLALGTSSVKLIEMAQAYSHFANNGKQVQPIFIQKITDYNGKILFENEMPEQKQILNEAATYVTTQLMTGMFDPSLNDYTTVTGRDIRHSLTRPYAGKSGTTETDSWMVGFSPQLTTAVWIGYDKGKEITSPREKQYSKYIWAQFMEDAHTGMPVHSFKKPKTVVGKYINPDNGKLATESCPNKRFVYYLEGTEPTQYCNEHLHEDLDAQPEVPEQKSWWKELFSF